MTSWHGVMTSQNSQNSLRYQLVAVLKWLNIFISVDIFGCRVTNYHRLCICMMSFCHNVTSWRHWNYYMTSWNLFPSSQPANLLENWFHFRFGNFCGLVNSTLLSISYLHDGIASPNDVMKSLYALYLSQLVEVLDRWFVFYSILSCWVHNCHRLCIYSRRNVITWLHEVTDMTIWRHKTNSAYISL